MTHSRTRSRASRATLLLVAALHVLTAAALPFTHRHALRGAADHVSATQDPAPGSADLHPCTICRTLAATHAAPSTTLIPGARIFARAVFPAAPDAPLAAFARDAGLPRAPPRA